MQVHITTITDTHFHMSISHTNPVTRVKVEKAAPEGFTWDMFCDDVAQGRVQAVRQRRIRANNKRTVGPRFHNTFFTLVPSDDGFQLERK